MSNRLLEIKDLWITYSKGNSKAQVIRGVNLEVESNEILGIVGESGSGKSTLGYAIIGLLPANAKVEKGNIIFEGEDLLKVPKSMLYKYRGRKIFMIFQDPMTSLNPTMRIEDQLAEVINGKGIINDSYFPLHWFISYRRRENISNRELRSELLEVLKKVGFKYPEIILRKYPHELSGGERQRVMIALAYLLKPKLLIADEPTTALDMITQAHVIKLLFSLKEDYNTSIIFISHDIMLVKAISDRIVVMYAGMIMEESSSEEISNNPLHPYTKGLLDSIPNTYKEEGKLNPIPGYPPNIFNIPEGCPFNPRCKFVMNSCKTDKPILKPIKADHYVACHLYG